MQHCSLQPAVTFGGAAATQMQWLCNTHAKQMAQTQGDSVRWVVHGCMTAVIMTGAMLQSWACCEAVLTGHEAVCQVWTEQKTRCLKQHQHWVMHV